MKYVQIPESVVETMIQNLQRSYDVCINVDSNSDEIEKSPYYAAGYSRATMVEVIEQLNYYKSASE